MGNTARQHHRRNCNLPVIISFTDGQGGAQSIQGTCLEISEKGLQVKSPQFIPYLSYVTLRPERTDISIAARVRHLTPEGRLVVLGLELREPLPLSLLDSISKHPFAQAPVATPPGRMF